MNSAYPPGRLVALLSLALVSCSGGSGGGGSGGSSGGGNPPPPPPPPSQFTDVTSASGIRFEVGFSENRGDEFDIPYFSGGVASGDYDKDGDFDLFVVRGDTGPNLLYRNDGDNRFVDVADAAGLAYTKSAGENYRHSGPMFADMDGDGDQDLFVGGVQGDPSRIFANNGDGTFTDVTAGSGYEGLTSPQNVSAAFGDYDLDGDLDLFVSHWGTGRSESDPGDTEHLWRNVSTATVIRFESVSVPAGISPSIISQPDPLVLIDNIDYSFAPAFARIDDDIHPDIVLTGDVNTSMIFTNDGDGTFSNTTDVDVIRDANGMGSALGDYDNDGDLDWFVTSIFRDTNPLETNGNRLYRNDGGSFVDVTDSAGIIDGGWGWAACATDLDNDGHLDFYHTNGWQFEQIGDFTADTSRAFMSNGDGTFTNEAFSLGIADKTQGRGAVCADFDQDGDIDIFLWSSERINGGRLYRNDINENNYLVVNLRGTAPNTAAAGARIFATAAGTTQMREVTLGSNFVSQNPSEQHFGLGTASQVDALIVEWPDGSVTDLGIVQANQRIFVEQN